MSGSTATTTASTKASAAPEVDYTSKTLTAYTGARYTIEVCTKLKTNILTTATALTYFHKFYERTTFEQYDPFTIGCTCIYLASKIVDDDIRIRDIINVGLSCLKRNSPPLMLEPYFIMRDSLTQCELLLMRVINFKLKVDLPHKYLLHYLSALKDWIGKDTFNTIPVSSMAWRVLQDCYHSDLVIRKNAELVAVTCVTMALELYGVVVPHDLTTPWYTVLHTSCTKDAVSELTFQIFDLYEMENTLEFIKT
uniref:Cyclin-Q n=2 Tax=Hirondellea gigas TaxID=1518452 RepID=A0A6A7FR99_9CRUS